MKRQILATTIAVSLIIILFYLVNSNFVVIMDFVTGIAVVLVSLILGIIYWGFKPYIDNRFNSYRKTQIIADTDELISKPLDRIWKEDYRSQLDPKYSHIYAVLFYPSTISWSKGERTPSKNIPRFKTIINSNTQKAFYVCEFAENLIRGNKIQWYTETWKGEEEFQKYFKLKNITLIERPATEFDLIKDDDEKDILSKKEPTYTLQLNSFEIVRK